MKFIFERIPETSTFSIFDYDNKKGTGQSWEIENGSQEFEYEVPEDWTSPYYALRTSNYYIPNAYNILSGSSITFTGSDYYLDITRKKLEEELNQASIERLITGIQNNDELDFRQKFFVSLVSLQSYFEYLTYGMLVHAGFKTNNEFENLRTSNNRIDSAFSNANTFFFSDQISICPGKENLGELISDDNKDKIKEIFHMIRRMRNDVIHAWSYNNLSKEEIRDFFESVGEHVQMHLDLPDFYSHANHNFLRLYARVNYIKSQLQYFNQREYIRKEREERGY